MLIIVVFFMTLANLKQSIYQKILYLMIVGIYKMHISKNQIFNHSGDLIKLENVETKNIFINKKTLKIW